MLGLRYARTSTVGSVLFKSSHAMRFTNGGREWGWVDYKLRSDVGFHVEGNSPSSFAGGTVVAEKNVTWETNFMVFMAKAGKVTEFIKFVHDGTGVGHGNTELIFYALAARLGDGTWIINGSRHR